MNDSGDFNRAVDRWLDDGSDATPPAVIDAVLLAARNMPQERGFRVPWRTTSMTAYVRVAAVVALVAIGSTAVIFTLGRAGFGNTTASPSASHVLIARGSFVTDVDWVVEFEATRAGSDVTGRMTVSGHGQLEPYTFVVHLQCARTTEDGMIMIGGVVRERSGAEAPQVGDWAGIYLEPGSPVEATVWPRPSGRVRGGDCMEFLDEQLLWERATHQEPVDFADPPVEGTIELGP